MLQRLSHPVMQRARGSARLGFVSDGTKTRLKDLHQSGCLKAMIPRNHEAFPDAVLVNTAGGLTGGDELAIDITLDGGKLRAATQTAERIYRSINGEARISLTAELKHAACFDWLAQETILFDGGAVRRNININMDADCSLLCVEPVVLGRKAMGETVKTGMLSDNWRIKRGGKILYADALKIADFEQVKSPASLGEAYAFATILFIDPLAETKLATVRAVLNDSSMRGGASAWNGLLLCRILASDASAMRRTIIDIIKCLRGSDLPRVWTM